MTLHEYRHLMESLIKMELNVTERRHPYGEDEDGEYYDGYKNGLMTALYKLEKYAFLTDREEN